MGSGGRGGSGDGNRERSLQCNGPLHRNELFVSECLMSHDMSLITFHRCIHSIK